MEIKGNTLIVKDVVALGKVMSQQGKVFYNVASLSKQLLCFGFYLSSVNMSVPIVFY